MAANGRTKSQAELEAPAKVYQLEALDTKIDGIINQLLTIERQTSSTVTTTQMEDRLKESEQSSRDYTDNQVKLINKEYGPVKKGAWAVAGTVVLGIVFQIAINLMRLGK